MPRLSERDRERLSLFVDEMVAMRKQRDWSQADLAVQARYSKGLIGAVEIYERGPTTALARALDRAFGLPGTFERLHAKIRGTAFPAAFGEFAEHEARARSLLIFEHAMMPGLFQTEAYARSVLSNHPNVTPDEVSERVAGRLARQAVLTRDEPPLPVMWVLLDEFVLLREIGGPAVMADQLSHLADMAALPNVTVQVIPRGAGSHPGLLGKFDIAEFAGAETILFAEDIADGSISDDPATVAEVTLRWRYLASMALPVAASLELIQEALDRWTTERGVSQLTAVPTVDLV
jgi:transcriptional regulator with XRE-family HTH domain